MHELIKEIINSVSFFLIWYFLIVMSFYVVLILVSIPSIYKRFKEVGLEDISMLIKSESLPTISFIIPVYNLKQVAIATIYNMIDIEYPMKDIIIVNDGSTDETLDMMIKEFEFVPTLEVFSQKIRTQKIREVYQSKKLPYLRLINKENGGKNDANNAGINASNSQFFLVIDGDTILEKEALLHMIRPFFVDPDTLAQGGTLRILNGCQVIKGKISQIKIPKKILEGIQVVEYLRAFLYGRMGWNHLGGNMIVSGAFGLFDRKSVIEVGGYDIKSIAEDFEITMKISKYQRDKNRKQSIRFIPDPVAWTIVPSTLKDLGRQRARWHQGLCEVLVKYKRMIFNPKYRLTGLLGVPYMWIGELLEPLVEILGYIVMILGVSLNIFGFSRVLLFLAIAWGYSTFVTIISIILEVTTFRRYNLISQLLKLFVYSILENIGYRQISLWWRVKGFVQYFLKSKVW